MKLLITGANGQVGHELCRLASHMNIDTVCLDRPGMDITGIGSVRQSIALHRPDRVINAAAYTAVDQAESDADMAYRINRDGVENLAKCCKEFDIPLLHISTDYVFSGSISRPYIETDETDPVSVYGKSKNDGDRILASTWEKHVILRVSWVFGRHGKNFVQSMIRLGSEKEKLGIVDDQFGAPTPAECIARTLIEIAIYKKLGEKELPWGIRHLRSEPGVTWYQFAKIIFEEIGKHGITHIPDLKPITSDEYPTAAHRPANSKLNSIAVWPDEINDVCSWESPLRQIINEIYENDHSGQD